MRTQALAATGIATLLTGAGFMSGAAPAFANTGQSNKAPLCNCKTTADKAKQGADTKGVAFTIQKTGKKANATESTKPAKWCPPKKETKPPAHKVCPPKHHKRPVHKVCPPKHHKRPVTPPVVTPPVVTPPVVTSPVVATVPVAAPAHLAVLGVTATAPVTQVPVVAGITAAAPVGGVNTGDGSTAPTGLNLGYLLGGSTLLAGAGGVFLRRRQSA